MSVGHHDVPDEDSGYGDPSTSLVGYDAPSWVENGEDCDDDGREPDRSDL